MSRRARGAHKSQAASMERAERRLRLAIKEFRAGMPTELSERRLKNARGDAHRAGIGKGRIEELLT